MGQRLLVHVNDVEEKCSVYYHWSAYTYSSLVEANNLISGFKPNVEPHVWISNHLSQMGGGLSKEDHEYFPNLPLAEDRNEGIVHVTEDSRNEAAGWEAGGVNLDLANRVVSTDCYWTYKPKEWIDEDYGDEEDLKNLPIMKNVFSKLENIPFSKMPEVLQWWKEHHDDFPVIDAGTGLVVDVWA